MKTSDAVQIAEVAGHLARARPRFSASQAAEDALQIHQWARALTHYAEALCNRTLSHREEVRRDAVEHAVRSAATTWGARAETSRDPRGAVVKLHLKNGLTILVGLP